MKINKYLSIVVFFFGTIIAHSQERKVLSLKEAISIATTKSNEATYPI